MKRRALASLALAVVAVMAVASVPLLALGDDGRATSCPDIPQTTDDQISAVEFHDQWRFLWEDHVWYTREAIIDILTESPSTNATIDRLIRVANDTRDMMRPFYGDQVDDFYTQLVGHFTIAAQIVAGARDGANVTGLINAWFDNARNMTVLMNRMNPEFWGISEVNAMWNEHLNLTIQEALQYLMGQYAESIATFDLIEAQGVAMGDMFSNGIMNQFPDRFSNLSCVPMS